MVCLDKVTLGHPGWVLVQALSRSWPAGLCLVCGGDGSGKTSVLQMLAGVLAPVAGQVQYRLMEPALELALGPEKALDIFWRDPRAPLAAGEPEQTARAWAERQALQYRHWSAPDWQAHVQGLGLKAHLDKALYALSVGTLRKLWLAAAWASGAGLTLIDEPLAGLDKASVHYVQEALAQLSWAQQQRRATRARCVVVAHYDALPMLAWDDVLELAEQAA